MIAQNRMPEPSEKKRHGSNPKSAVKGTIVGNHRQTADACLRNLKHEIKTTVAVTKAKTGKPTIATRINSTETSPKDGLPSTGLPFINASDVSEVLGLSFCLSTCQCTGRMTCAVMDVAERVTKSSYSSRKFVFSILQCSIVAPKTFPCHVRLGD